MTSSLAATMMLLKMPKKQKLSIQSQRKGRRRLIVKMETQPMKIWRQTSRIRETLLFRISSRKRTWVSFRCV